MSATATAVLACLGLAVVYSLIVRRAQPEPGRRT